jgi:hygromycin-B 7''-O-kinase
LSAREPETLAVPALPFESSHNRSSVTYSGEIVDKIQLKHALSGTASLMPFTGTVNEAWAIGDELVLRINRKSDCDDEAAREALVVPLVRAAGLRTPELIVYDDERDIVPRPYTIYRRAPGVLLGNLEVPVESLSSLYQEIGIELAALHKISPPKGIRLRRANWEAWNVMRQLKSAIEDNLLSGEEAREIERWLDFVAPLFGEPETGTLIHKDIHPWNLMVDPGTFDLTAILDWGDASVGDVADEFAAMPLVAVPSMFLGYQTGGEPMSEALVARSLFSGLGLALWEIREGDPQNYRRTWWRMPVDGWHGYKKFIEENYPRLAGPV